VDWRPKRTCRRARKLLARRPLFCQLTTQFLHLQLELDEAPNDELELPPFDARTLAHHRTHVHGKKPRATALTNLSRNVRRTDLTTGREHHHALHEIPELAHVARPRILHEHVERLRRDPLERSVVLLR